MENFETKDVLRILGTESAVKKADEIRKAKLVEPKNEERKC